MEDIKSLLFMADIVENGLDISIRGHYVNLGSHTHELRMANYFQHTCVAPV